MQKPQGCAKQFANFEAERCQPSSSIANIQYALLQDLLWWQCKELQLPCPAFGTSKPGQNQIQQVIGKHIELDSAGSFFCSKEPGLFSLAASQLQTVATNFTQTVHNIHLRKQGNIRRHRQETVTAFSPIIMPFTRSMACEATMKTWSWTQILWLFAWAINIWIC